MSLSRRKTLAIIGGGVITAAAASAGAFALTREPTKALAPWGAAGGESEPRRRALSYAILAPNPHNRQPWLVDLDTPDTVILHLDRDRLLPHTDPYDRQITIGLGCFLELMVQAANEDGQSVALDLYPEGEDGPVAVARFSDGGTADPLFAQVMDRRSCKEPFDSRPVPADAVESLAGFANVIAAETQVAALRDLTWEAFHIEMMTHRTLKESIDLMRMGKAEINANPDGIDLGGPFLEALMLMGVLTREAQLDPNSTAFGQALDMFRTTMYATPAYATIVTPGNTRTDQIEAGRRWLRLNLKTTELGLALHPVSQALQEYPEMSERYRQAHEMLAAPGETVQMLGRLGYGPATPRSPRWPLDTRIRNG